MKLPISAPNPPLRVVDLIEDYAAVHAHMRRFRDQAAQTAVLEALHVDDAQWSTAHRWTDRMADAAMIGDLQLMNDFSSAYGAALVRIGAAPTEASIPATSPMEQSSSPAPGLSLLSLSNAAAGEREAPAAPSASAGRDAVQRASDPLETTLSIEVLRPPELVLPFIASSTMSIDQYASMCASLDVFPEKRSIILARYCIGDEAHLVAVHGAFRRMFADQPASEAAFRQRSIEVSARLGERG